MTADVGMAKKPFDWLALLPLRQGSCLNLSFEPCVKKAVFHLNVLKTQLQKKDKEEKGQSLAKPSFSEIHAEREKDERLDSKSSKAVTMSMKSLAGRVNNVKVSQGNSECWVILKISPLLRHCKQLHSSIAHTGRSSK